MDHLTKLFTNQMDLTEATKLLDEKHMDIYKRMTRPFGWINPNGKYTLTTPQLISGKTAFKRARLFREDNVVYTVQAENNSMGTQYQPDANWDSTNLGWIPYLFKLKMSNLLHVDLSDEQMAKDKPITYQSESSIQAENIFDSFGMGSFEMFEQNPNTDGSKLINQILKDMEKAGGVEQFVLQFLKNNTIMHGKISKNFVGETTSYPLKDNQYVICSTCGAANQIHDYITVGGADLEHPDEHSCKE